MTAVEEMTSTTNVHSPADVGPRSRLLFELCSETLADLLDYYSKHHQRSMENVVIAADFHAKRLVLVVPLPEDFKAMKTSTNILRDGVTYPVIASIESKKLDICCSSHEWTTFFTPNGQAFATQPRILDKVLIRHKSLVRQEAYLKDVMNKLNQLEKQESVKEKSSPETYIKDQEARARKNKKAREKQKRQKVRRKELKALEEEESVEEDSEEGESEKGGSEDGDWVNDEKGLRMLEDEVLIDESKVTKEKMARAIMVTVHTVTAYKKNLARAKRLGFKIVRRLLSRL